LALFNWVVEMSVFVVGFGFATVLPTVLAWFCSHLEFSMAGEILSADNSWY
jgi:hypothetical protein